MCAPRYPTTKLLPPPPDGSNTVSPVWATASSPPRDLIRQKGNRTVKPATKLRAYREKSSRRTEPVVKGTESLKSLDNRTGKVAF